MSKISMRTVVVQLPLSEVALSLGQNHWVENDDLSPDWTEIKTETIESNKQSKISARLEVFRSLCPKTFMDIAVTTLKKKALDHVWKYRRDYIKHLLRDIWSEAVYEGVTGYGEPISVIGVEYGVSGVNIVKDVVEIELCNPDQMINHYMVYLDIGLPVADKCFCPQDLAHWLLRSLTDYKGHPAKVLIPPFKLNDSEITEGLLMADRKEIVREALINYPVMNRNQTIDLAGKQEFSKLFPDIKLEESDDPVAA